MTAAERAELLELQHRLYGGQPGQVGDIPALREDVAAIKTAVSDLAGFYRTLVRIGKGASAVGAIGTLLLIGNSLLRIL